MTAGTSLGILVQDRTGSVVFSSGLAADPAFQRLFLAAWTPPAEQTIVARAVPVGGADYVVFAHRNDDATAFFIHRAARDKTLLDFIASVDFAQAILTHFVTSPYEAMVVVDDQAVVRFISPVHEKFLGLKTGEAIGRPVTEVIANTRLHEVVRSGKAEIGQLQEMNGVTRVVARIPIMQDGRVVGAIGQIMFKEPETLHELSRELNRLRSEVAFYQRELSGMKRRTYGLEQIVGRSEPIRQLKADIVKVAPLDVPVLLVGESGTGKELAAHAIHALSPRHEHPMVLVNAAALPPGLVESELFGYEPGAFTGAEKKGRKGKFELADNSSLFFDEIGDMPAEIQVKLLRVLQDGMFERVGGDRQRHSDFRLISASNRDFNEMIRTGKFRLDLFYRISGVTIRMPPLRDRLEDIPELVESFLVHFAARHRSAVKGVKPRVYGYLKEQPWPGNVRQLLHEVEKAAIFCEGPEIDIPDFRPLLFADEPAAPAPAAQVQGSIQTVVEDVENKLIREAMIKFGGNKKRVAEELGISRSYLYKKLASM